MMEAIVFVGDVAPEGPGGLVWVALLLLALVVAGGVWWKGRSAPPRLEGEGTRELPESGARTAREERKAIDGPVRITQEMSLREVREAKQARLTGEYKGADAAREERERRRGVGRATTGALLPIDDDGDPGSDAAPPAVRTADRGPTHVDAAGQVTAGEAHEPDAGDAAEASAVGEGAEPASDAGAEETAVSSVVREDDGSTRATEPVSPEPKPVPAASSAGRSMADGLAKTRGGFVARLGALFSRPKLDAGTLEELEEILFTADIGVATGQRLLEKVQSRVREDADVRPEVVWGTLREEIVTILAKPKGTLRESLRERPAVFLMVGVNGAGKTTTIGKLAAAFVDQGKRVLLVAGDTFRAAAVNQLVEWGERTGCDVHRAGEGADPSGVVYDGLQRAVAEGYDVVLCDTAGRLQNKRPLMDELEKILRVAAKAIPGAPHESILVVDANTGQNALEQARQFGAVAKLTGVVLTKLDGTAKGGVVIGISDELELPIYFVGIGEAVEDLRRFDAREFAEALL